ncbi:MAG: PEP-CTERM sorting domain-containing protein [Methylophilus sp.]
MMNQLSFKPLSIVALTAFSLNIAPAFAAIPTGIQDAIPVAKSLNGTKKDDGWYNLSAASKTKTVDGSPVTIAGIPGGGFPGMAPLPNVISQVSSDNDNSATFRKVSNGAAGGAFPSSESLYAGSLSGAYNFNGGKLGVFETAPVDNLANVVFQVELGGANGYDFYQPSVGTTTTPGGASALSVGALTVTNYFPTLNLIFGDNTTTQLTANWAELSFKGENGTTSASGTEEPIYINLYAFQWDLSGYSNISSFNVTYDVVAHSQTYAARLTQSDTFNQVVAVPVPEPESYAMILAGLGMVALVARRRRQV